MHNQQPAEGAKVTENGQSQEGENVKPIKEKETDTEVKENGESKDKVVNGDHDSKKIKEENKVEDGKKEDALKASSEAIVDEMKTKGIAGADKCPALKRLDSTDGGDLPKELDSATEEAAKALATSPKKDGCKLNSPCKVILKNTVRLFH